MTPTPATAAAGGDGPKQAAATDASGNPYEPIAGQETLRRYLSADFCKPRVGF